MLRGVGLSFLFCISLCVICSISLIQPSAVLRDILMMMILMHIYVIPPPNFSPFAFSGISWIFSSLINLIGFLSINLIKELIKDKWKKFVWYIVVCLSIFCLMQQLYSTPSCPASHAHMPQPNWDLKFPSSKNRWDAVWKLWLSKAIVCSTNSICVWNEIEKGNNRRPI